MNDTKTTALALPTGNEWGTITQMAEVLVPSGMLPAHIKTPAAAAAIILKGRELGIPPMQALSGIAVIQGKPVAGSELMLAILYRDHGDNCLWFTETSEVRCAVSYARRNWTERREYQFTIDDAKRAGLLTNQTWTKYPAAMLRARAISAVARMAFPDSIGGMYMPEELGAMVTITADGEEQFDGTTIVDIGTGEVTERPAFANAPADKPTPRTEPRDEIDTTASVNADILGKLHGTAKAKGWTHEDLHDYAVAKYNVMSISDLTIGQAYAIGHYLKTLADAPEPVEEQPTLPTTKKVKQ